MSELYDIEEFPEDTFSLSFNIIYHYQQEDPFLTEKITCAEYSKGSFRGGQRIINLITYKYKIDIPQKLQKYIVKWYHTYILHPGLDKMDSMIIQQLYLPGIREVVYREVTYCDTCQHTKRSTHKYSDFTAKPTEEKHQNKLCVDIICPYKIRRKRKDTLILKAVTMIDPVTAWFEIT